MLQEALTSGTGSSLPLGGAKKKKGGKKKKSKVGGVGERLDLQTRVLNDYGDNPHL